MLGTTGHATQTAASKMSYVSSEHSSKTRLETQVNEQFSYHKTILLGMVKLFMRKF